MKRYPAPVADYVDEVVASWREARPDLDTTPLAAVTRILRAAQLIQQRLDALAGADRRLSHKGDLDTLTALRRAGHVLSPKALARVGQLTSGGMTNRLDRLEASELITRSPDPADRRSVLVALTPHGERLADEAFAISLAVQDEILAPLSAADRRALERILRKLLESLGDVPLGTAAEEG